MDHFNAGFSHRRSPAIFRLRDKAVVRALFVTYLCAAAAQCGTFAFSGNFSQDDDITTISISLTAPATLSVQTLSFAGGLSSSGAAIAPGGFEPVLSLFDSTGTLLAIDSVGGTAPSACGGRGVDPGSGFCLDALLNTPLSTGAYTLALTESDNVPNTLLLADGFSRQGQGNFTGPDNLGQPGSFVLFDGSQRTNFWAIDVANADAADIASVPEPGVGWLAAIGLCLLLPLRILRSRHV